MPNLSHRIFTSESVSEGHPDKVADQISDAILDACLEQDIEAKVACETMCTAKKIIISGEISTSAKVNYIEVARKVIRDIGHTKKSGLDPEIEIENLINCQSSEVKDGITHKSEADQGAGDQGIIFGYATNEINNTILMPWPITLANELVFLASKLRKNGQFHWAWPDMKSQVSYNYKENKITTILMSIQHRPFQSKEDRKNFRQYVQKEIFEKVAKKYQKNLDFQSLINPAGDWTIKGGPQADTGLTGRKVIVDTYGGMSRHGGGAFSGKDPSKMDRTGAYGARFIAKNIVYNGWADRCEIQLSYAIGIAEPISIDVFTFGTAKASDSDILNYIRNTKNYDCTPYGFIKNLNLKRPIYRQTAAYGHFTNQDLPWEQLFNSTKKILAKD